MYLMDGFTGVRGETYGVGTELMFKEVLMESSEL